MSETTPSDRMRTVVPLLLALGLVVGFAGGWYGRQAPSHETHCYIVAGAVTVRTKQFSRYEYQAAYGSHYAPAQLVCR
ncbi:MAG TPA: hypothetical protein VLU96_09315 [Gaiellaceae bacterium]|nr:hypothetical protein [Gaiellaceae bacterium]